jgi:SecD/SecF fusion protein
VLRAIPPEGRRLAPLDIERSLLIMRDRIDRLGIAEHDVRRLGGNEIVIQLAGVRHPAAAARIIGEPARLEVYDLEPNLVAGPAPTLFSLFARAQARAKPGAPMRWYAFGRGHELVAGPAPTRAALLSRDLPDGYRILAIPRHTVVLGCARGVCDTPSLYLFRRDPARGIPELTAGDFRGSSVTQFDPEAPVVPVGLTQRGARRLERLTAREARRGRARGRNQHAVIVLDRTIESVVTLDYRALPHGVRGTTITIRGGDVRELAHVALVLHTGALPAAFEQLERTEVSATLGRGSLREAGRAAVVGLALVALFLLLLYRFLGLVAILGLVVYAALLYGLILREHVTLTLPGLAGLILTIGLAADANVVVFERIKDEVRRGKRVRAAVHSGYAKGFRTIVDAHVVTAITALVLFAVVTAGVRGFALMLLFGTVVSLFTAVVATRAILWLFAGFAWFDDPRVMGAGGPQRLKVLEIDFVRRRWLWLALSAAVIAAGGVSLATRGLDLGIDFRSGSQLTFTTPERHSTEDVRAVTRLVGRGEAVVQGRGSAVRGRYDDWQVRTSTLTPSEKTTLERDLRERIGARAVAARTVSASFARHLVRLTVWAILGSLVLVALYVKVRFGFKFAIPVVVGLLHDLAVTLGVYSLGGREVNAPTMAAVLTVLGYSLYDTVIVFDRIRENTRILLRPRFATLANISLWQTVRRSLATTVVTLLPVAALLVFGGPSLKDFAFAILVGVVAGAYSSIFVASPLLAALKGREPEFTRRGSTAAAAEPQALLRAAEAAAATPALRSSGEG